MKLKKRYKLWLAQHEMSLEIQKKTGIGIVTCPDCGYVVLSKNADKKITCPHCMSRNNTDEYPDLFINMSKEDIKNLPI